MCRYFASFCQKPMQGTRFASMMEAVLKYGSLQGLLSFQRSLWMRGFLSATLALTLLGQALILPALWAAQQEGGKITPSLQSALKLETLRAIEEEPGQIRPLRLESIELGTPKKITR